MLHRERVAIYGSDAIDGIVRSHEKNLQFGTRLAIIASELSLKIVEGAPTTVFCTGFGFRFFFSAHMIFYWVYCAQCNRGEGPEKSRQQAFFHEKT